jgi:uncharacterized protein with von Willebrand factor type A (vWA) domain
MTTLADNIVHFARTLRRTGFPLGTGQINEALRAVETVGVARRDDLHAALFATLVTHPGQRPLFEQAFDAFWRDPGLCDKALAALLPQTLIPPREFPPAAGARRVAEVLRGQAEPRDGQNKVILELDARETASPDDLLAAKDFEQMSGQEITRAKAALARMTWSLPERRTRRTEAAARGHAFDLRRTLRKSLKTGGNIVRLERRRRQTREPPLVVLCDISGSMSGYARMCLHFLHGLTHTRHIRGSATHTFLFGTRLTNVTRALRLRDPDEALAKAAALAPDWDGGTRIAETLTRFNRDWSRRVLGQGAVVLLITDGLERDDIAALTAAAERLHRSAKRLIWLNPLLRYDAFAPKALGVKTLLAHVDELRPVHNLNSMADLAASLSGPARNDRLQTVKDRAA